MTPWVLLRGLTRESRHWGDFPRRFADKLGGVETICLDLPGNGALHASRSPPSVAALAEHCHVELAARGVARPCQVLAMSLGAMVAIEWTARHAEDVAGAVLINTSARPWCGAHRRLRPGNLPRVLRLLLAPPSPVEMERVVLEMTSSRVRTRHERDALLDEWRRWRLDAPVSAANAARQLLAAARYRAPARPPSAPLLLLASRGDALVSHRCSERMAAEWGLPLALHEWAGHDLPLDDADWVIEQVANWAPCRQA